MIIREVNINDADALSDIYKYYVDNFPYSFEYVAPSAEEFAERIDDISEKFPFFVCEDNGEIIGFAYAHKFKERKAYQWVCETSIYAKNGCTQKGVGKLLYENLLPALKQQGFVKAFAVLGCPNEGSEIFHQKMGFSFVSTLPNIGYKLGSWHDIKYYVLELNPFRDDMPEPLEYHQIKQEKETYETDEERQARIYPVILSEYNPAWPEWYLDEKSNLERLIGVENIARISHFGSTSVPGLTAKPTVDILLEIKDDTNVSKLIDALSSPEYICLNPPDMPTPPPHLMFLKGYLPTGFAEKVYHIHVRYPRDSANHAVIWDELYFRNYLIAHPETAAEYAALKTKLHKGFEHDRNGYTNAKTAFIREVMEKARKL